MYIHAYNSEGTQLSEGTGLAPLTAGPLNASLNETSAAIPVTIKVDAGYSTFGNTTVSFVGDTAAKWSACATADGTFAATLTLADAITEAGKTIFVKAAASADEAPTNDTSVDLKIQAVVAAA